MGVQLRQALADRGGAPVKLWAALLAAALTWYVGKALGVPVWNDGWTLEAIGDRTDWATTTGCLVWTVLTVLQRDRERT